MKEAGTKHDLGKDPWDLLPWDAACEVVRVVAFGASKYGRGNWERGIAYSRVFAAAQRHLTAWWQRREDTDEETGLSHLAHAACCVLFLLAFVMRGREDLDNRPRSENGPVGDARVGDARVRVLVLPHPYASGAFALRFGANGAWLYEGPKGVVTYGSEAAARSYAERLGLEVVS